MSATNFGDKTMAPELTAGPQAPAAGAAQQAQSPQADVVSVVIPMYNVAATLDASLRSLEAQTHTALQIICVNDGSTDDTLAIAQAHAAADQRFVIVDKPNGGYGAACNAGLARACGTWVAILEPDDLLEPGCYADLVACAAGLGGAAAVDVVKAPYWRAFPAAEGAAPAADDGVSVADPLRDLRLVACPYQNRVHPRRQPFSIEDGVELLLHHPAIWAALYSRSYLERRGIRFVEAPGAGWTDNPFMAQTLLATDRIAYTDRPGYIYVERDLNEADGFAGRSPLVPLTRWNEMMDAAAQAHVTSVPVLKALAVRGVNYAVISCEAACRAAGLVGTDVYAVTAQNTELKSLVDHSMKRLDPAWVFDNGAISPAGKRLFAASRGLAVPARARLNWYAHLAAEALYRIRVNGPSFVLETIRSRRGARLG